ncbi:PA containing protein [Pseudonocardia sp. DSM 110487]|jgi:chromosome segregation ATPase|uniref:PA containing protein n=1 Tax=Pseudonocardia sp. DSM 110487 TaxID=2865833 RepID=UPI001C69F866|nr:PA containing protein [Pseudonocardia sp. DSM 110487]QYN34940.1 PA containing protein [Pseudonocardia sp. DSM 110487]
MSNDSTLSFDRMRGMLMRAAEIRDSEQQQIFDSLDEIHARLAALDALGTVRKRLTELPDRTEVSVLAERLDETVAKLDAQDASIASVLRAVEAMPDKLAKPIAQLDGRLDGMAGRLEGVSGRMDGLDDRLGGLHKRLDDLDNRLDRHEMRLDAMPSSVGAPIKERVDGIERLVREQLDNAIRSVDESGEGLRNLLGDTSVGLHRRLEDLAARPAVDPTEPLNGLEKRLENLAARLDAIEDGMSGRLGNLGGTIDEKLGKLDAAIVERPDTSSLRSLVERANAESERRNAGQLDEAMATFAELILGRGPSVHQMPPPPPRQTPRRNRSKVTVKSPNGASAHDTVTDDPDD